MAKIPLISICIPTFNRSTYLLNTLNSITSQSIFVNTSYYEIVISDNCSSDNTTEIVNLFIAQFGSKVRYFRNNKNLDDGNLQAVLSRSEGIFRKVSNDTALWNNNSLQSLLDFVQNNITNKPILFFNNNVFSNGNFIYSSTDFNDFIDNASFESTWVGSFGIWDTDFHILTDTEFNSSTKLPQTSILFYLINLRKSFSILNYNFCTIQNTGKKSGYNIAQIFGFNYLNILSPYLSNSLKFETYQKEKYNILTKHILPFYFTNEHDFHKTGFFKYMSHYKNDEFFYDAIENFIFSRFTK